MKFTHRIMLGPVVAAVAFLFVFALVQAAAERSSRTIVRIQDEVFHATELSSELQIDLLRIRYLLTEAATNGNEDAVGEADRVAADFRRALASCASVPALAEMLAPVRDGFENYYDQARDTTRLMLAQAGGVDLQKTFDAVSKGAAGSWMFTNRAPQIIARDWRPGFTVDLQQKDLRLVLDAADELGVPIPGTSLVFNLYRTLEARGLGSEGNHALIKALENLAGYQVGG